MEKLSHVIHKNVTDRISFGDPFLGAEGPGLGPYISHFCFADEIILFGDKVELSSRFWGNFVTL